MSTYTIVRSVSAHRPEKTLDELIEAAECGTSEKVPFTINSCLHNDVDRPIITKDLTKARNLIYENAIFVLDETLFNSKAIFEIEKFRLVSTFLDPEHPENIISEVWVDKKRVRLGVTRVIKEAKYAIVDIDVNPYLIVKIYKFDVDNQIKVLVTVNESNGSVVDYLWRLY